MTIRLPSLEIISSGGGEARLEIGLSPLALHTGVNLGTLSNHIPRYVWLELPSPGAGGLKKPSANLPLLETSLSSLASAWPRERMFVAGAAEDEVVCREKISPQASRRRRMTSYGRKWTELTQISGIES